MVKEIIATIVILAAIVGLAYLIYYFSVPNEGSTPLWENKGKDKAEDEITLLLRDIKTTTGIEFSEIEDMDFKWFTMTGSGIKGNDILGQYLVALNSSTSDYESAKSFLEGRGFAKNQRNSVEGAIGHSTGYQKGEIACIATRVINKNTEDSTEANSIDVSVRCGKTETAAEKSVNEENACLDAGGEIATSSCCLSTSDLPNLCTIGACGCSAENSHEIQICDCGSSACFDGTTCIKQEAAQSKSTLCVAATGESMTLKDAETIAMNTAECKDVGIPSGFNSVCNENTSTWWLEIATFPEQYKDGCNPACVVSVKTEEAGINWRCTGLIPG